VGSDEFVYELKIPKERVAVLIGKDGNAKKALEDATKVRINVDSSEGDVTLRSRDGLALYTAREIVRAIGRGFSPEKAQGLLDPENGFEIINIKDYAKHDEDVRRLAGRVIGESGKSRRIIEELTGVAVSVYGKTICLLGKVEGMPVARRAIESLLAGSRHATVYKWLEQQHRKLREQTMMETF
jgi:ribosomal RNA assembly protein